MEILFPPPGWGGAVHKDFINLIHHQHRQGARMHGTVSIVFVLNPHRHKVLMFIQLSSGLLSVCRALLLIKRGHLWYMGLLGFGNW